MLKMFYLVKTTGLKTKIIDSTIATYLLDAEKIFKSRHLFYKILKKSSLKILEERKVF